MGLIDWSGTPSFAPSRRIRVRIGCEYPGTPLEPTSVEFQPAASLGSTPAAVHAAILTMLVTSEEFGLPAVGEKTPFPFASETLRSIVVR